MDTVIESDSSRGLEVGELYRVNRLVTVGELTALVANELCTPLAVIQATARGEGTRLLTFPANPPDLAHRR